MNFTLAQKADSLCESCLNGVVLTFKARGNSSAYCQIIDQKIHGSVAECSRYTWKWSESKYEHDKIAWVIETNPKTKAIGFTPPKRTQEIPE